MRAVLSPLAFVLALWGIVGILLLADVAAGARQLGRRDGVLRAFRWLCLALACERAWLAGSDALALAGWPWLQQSLVRAVVARTLFVLGVWLVVLALHRAGRGPRKGDRQ